MPQNAPSAYAIRSKLGLNVGTPNTAILVASQQSILFTVVVTTAGAAGAIYDSATTGGISAANLIGTVPATVGIYQFFGFPCKNGIVYNPGAGQIASISYT